MSEGISPGQPEKPNPEQQLPTEARVPDALRQIFAERGDPLVITKFTGLEGIDSKYIGPPEATKDEDGNTILGAKERGREHQANINDIFEERGYTDGVKYDTEGGVYMALGHIHTKGLEQPPVRSRSGVEITLKSSSFSEHEDGDVQAYKSRPEVRMKRAVARRIRSVGSKAVELSRKAIPKKSL